MICFSVEGRGFVTLRKMHTGDTVVQFTGYNGIKQIVESICTAYRACWSAIYRHWIIPIEYLDQVIAEFDRIGKRTVGSAQ